MANLQGVAFAKETICAIDSSYSLTFEKTDNITFPITICTQQYTNIIKFQYYIPIKGYRFITFNRVIILFSATTILSAVFQPIK